MPHAVFEVIGPNQYKVTIQVNFWDRANRLAFDRAECWEEIGGVDQTSYGACNFSIIADIEPSVLPEPGFGIWAGILVSAMLAKRRKGKW